MRVFYWIGRMALACLLMTAVSVLTTYIMVSVMVDGLLKQAHLTGLSHSVSVSDFIGKLSDSADFLLGGGGSSGRDASNDTSNDTSPGADASLGDSGSGGSGDPLSASAGAAANAGAADDSAGKGLGSSADGTPASGAAGTSKTPGEEDAVEAWSQVGGTDGSGSGSSGAAGGEDDATIMSAEQFQQKKAAMSSDDKAAVFSLLTSKLPEEDLQKLSQWVEDGITAKEYNEIYAMVQKQLTTADLSKLEAILKKY